MNDRAIELFKQAGEEAYKLCKEHGHKVGDIDTIWVSIMAATLAELVVKECAVLVDADDDSRPYATFGIKIKKHFGVTE